MKTDGVLLYDMNNYNVRGADKCGKPLKPKENHQFKENP